MKVTPPAQMRNDDAAARSEPGVDGARAERRRHLRAELPVPAVLLLPGGEEVPAHLLDISAGGAKVACDAELALGDRVVFYAAPLGRLEATVVRAARGHVALSFCRKPGSVTRLADSLSWALNAPEAEERRTAKRYRSEEPVTVILPDGAALPCRVLDASPEGASLELSLPLAIGETIEVGRMTARVVRHHEAGVGITFIGPSRES